MSKKKIKSIISKYAEPLNDNHGGFTLVVKSNNFKEMIKDLTEINNTFCFSISSAKLESVLINTNNRNSTR
jgi:hypothetical protein